MYCSIRVVFSLIYVIFSAFVSSTADTLDRTVSGRTSLIRGLLGGKSRVLASRQEQEECPFEGGIFCNSIYCCPPGTICQPDNHSVEFACCPTPDLKCNSGTACCVPGISECCTTSPFGCCPVDTSEPPPPEETQSQPTPTEKPKPTAPQNTPTAPTDTRVPKDTISLDYQDMLTPRKKTQDAATRKLAVDSLFKNMCLGMQKRGVTGQSEIFTYSRSQQSANRQTACGQVKCATGQSCDEYPFASTTDGGVGAIGNCIEALGNSIQGGFLSTLLKEKNIMPNDNYELELTNVNCEELLGQSERRDLLFIRQQETSGLTTQLQEIDMYAFGPFTLSDFYNHSLYYIGDMSTGQYTVSVKVNDGIVDAFRIIDYQGFAYASSDASTGILDPVVSLPFSLPEAAVGVTLMLDMLIDVNVSASMSAGTTASSSSVSPGISETALASSAATAQLPGNRVHIALVGMLSLNLVLGI